MIEPDASSRLEIESSTLSIAVARADRLGLDDSVLAAIIGLPGPAASRVRRGDSTLAPGGAPPNLSVLFVRMFIALDALTAGDERTAKAWLANRNDALGNAPFNLIQTAAGLAEVVGYLDSRNARA